MNKLILSLIAIFLINFLQAQTIDSVLVRHDTVPKVITVWGKSPGLEFSRKSILSTFDINYTTRLGIYFKGCPDVYDTINFEVTTYYEVYGRMDLYVYTYRDTSESCNFPDKPIRTDTVFVKYQAPNALADINQPLVSFYPNPSAGMLYFNKLNYADQLKIKLFNYQGQLITEEWLDNTLNLSKYDSGIYQLLIYDTSGKLILADKLLINKK